MASENLDEPGAFREGREQGHDAAVPVDQPHPAEARRVAPSKANLRAQLADAARNTAILTDDAFHGGEPSVATQSGN